MNRYDSVEFHVAYQEEMKGDGHAILQARDWMKSEYLAILFGDDLYVRAIQASATEFTRPSTAPRWASERL